MKRLVMLTTVFFTLAVGCGEADVEWSDWQNYPDEDSTGELVEGEQWSHSPTYLADTPRQFRYKTSRDVDGFVAPADNCDLSNAYESWSDVDDIEIGDYSDDVSGDSGQPVCVELETDLLTDGGQWHVEPLVRQGN